MKLYATVSSERATKTQGGNKKLDFSLCVGSGTFDSHEIVRVGAYYGDDGIVYLSITQPYEHSQEHRFNLKGEKQKGEDYSNPRIAHKTHEQGDEWHD